MAHEPQQLEDPLIEDESSPTAVVRKGEDLACTPTLPLRHRPRKQDVGISPTIDHHFVEAPVLQITVC